MSRVGIAGGSLFARIDGDIADAPWVVLSNGIATDHTMWDPQMAALTRRYRVLRYDTRGHGASDAPAGPYSFDTLVDDVAALLDHFGIERASFIGLSLGGMTGLGFALRHPDRLDALVCCNARSDAPEPFIKSWTERMAAIRDGGMAAIAQITLDRWLKPATHAANPALVDRLRQMILATSPLGFASCAAALQRLDYLKDLGSIEGRVLYVGGAEDGGAPVAIMRQMADRTPRAEFAIVPDAAHISNLDNPAGFIAAVSSFLNLAPAESALA